VIRRTFLGLAAALVGLRPRRAPALAVPPGLPRRTGLLIRVRLAGPEPIPVRALVATRGCTNDRRFRGLPAGTVLLSSFAYGVPPDAAAVVQYLYKSDGWGPEYPRKNLGTIGRSVVQLKVEPYTFPTRVPPWIGGRILHGPLDDPASLAELDRSVRAWAAHA
jgi:hypothetical protein